MTETLKFSSALQNHLREIFGEEFDQFEAAINQSASTAIRINPNKVSTPKNLTPIPWNSNGFYLQERPVFTLDPWIHAGCYYVQDASSMFLEQALKTIDAHRNTIKILDLCAAPGGKSTLIQSTINANSLLVANETVRSRSEILKENLIKWGLPNKIICNNDPKDFKDLSGFFDVVVADVPCSGEGLFRKNSKAISEWSVNNVDLCSKRQKRIVADIWPAIAEDGYLIYSTCTFNKYENEEIVNWICEKLNGEHIPIEFSSSQIDATPNALGKHFYPHKVSGEGFYIAIVKKNGGSCFELKPKKNKKKKLEQSVNWICEDDWSYFSERDRIHVISLKWGFESELIRQQLNVIYSGIAVAEPKGSKLAPTHDVAVSTILNPNNNFEAMELELPQALQYLNYQALPIATQLGLLLMQHRGINLGWSKSIGNRLNNLYPKKWRIRMNINSNNGFALTSSDPL